MRFDLVDLQLFVAVAETRSITNGAAKVHLALASASARIKGLEEALGVRPFRLDLAHVRDVEQPGARAHRHVLVGDARVLDGHVPAAEFDHPCAERTMTGVEGSLFQSAGRWLCHGRWRVRNL